MKVWTDKEEDKLVSMIRLFTCEEIGKTLGRSTASVRKRIAYGGLPFKRNVLVIMDIHAPFTKTGYLEFCIEQYKIHNCTSVVFAGDILDNHFSSFHETDPDGYGAKEELRRAKEIVQQFHDAFPVAKCCLGNHDIIPDRKRFSAGLSGSWIKTIDEVLDVKGWEFAEEWIIDNVLYTHGTGRKAKQRCVNEMMSVAQGHFHSDSYVEYFVSEDKLIFAAQGGCGVDRKAYAMAYGKNFKKPQVNVIIVKDNGRSALIEHMPMGN